MSEPKTNAFAAELERRYQAEIGRALLEEIEPESKGIGPETPVNYIPPNGTTTRCGENKAVFTLNTAAAFDGSLESGKARYGPNLGNPAGEPENVVTESERQQAYQWLEWKGYVIDEQAIHDICLGYTGTGRTLISAYNFEYQIAHKPLPVGVGFQLPRNRNVMSRMSHLPAPHVININYDPWAGGYPPGSAAFYEAMQGRYGKPLDPWLPIDSCPGLHSSDYNAALNMIAEFNPGWFAERGYGMATGVITANDRETTDAYYADGVGQELIAESARLGIEQGGGEVPEPPTPAERPPLSMPTAEMKDTASNIDAWLPADYKKRRPRQMERINEWGRWTLTQPTRPE